jgi:CRISPR-associated protein Csx3
MNTEFNELASVDAIAMPQISLEVAALKIEQWEYQFVTIQLARLNQVQLHTSQPRGFSDRITPDELKVLQLPEELDDSQGIVLFGRAPIWLYAFLVQQCKNAAAPWVACFNMKGNGAIVVASRVESVPIGTVVPVPQKAEPGMAILIGGPPDSGKSVFSYALQRSLRQYANGQGMQIYLHRANWDGEGNWTFETPDGAIVEEAVKRGMHPIHLLYGKEKADALMAQYFKYQAELTRDMRKIVDVTLVDIGGKIQDEKHPLLDVCSHYIVISKDVEEAANWQKFCDKRGLQPLAVIHSKWAEVLERKANDRCLEFEAGKWDRKTMQELPPEMLEAMVQRIW